MIVNAETYHSDIVDKLLGLSRVQNDNQKVTDEVEVIGSSGKYDVANLLSDLRSGGNMSYTMEYVPLKLGVKINPDDRYYT